MEKDLCSICLEDIDSNYVNLKCKHKFHLNCYIEMAMKNPEYLSCPNCRTKIGKNKSIFEMNNIKKKYLKMCEEKILLKKQMSHLKKMLACEHQLFYYFCKYF